MADSSQDISQLSPDSKRPAPDSSNDDRADPAFDRDGVPRDSPVSAWAASPPWAAGGHDFDRLDVEERRRVEAGWLLALLRFTRPDGSPVFGPRGRSRDRLRAIVESARRVADPSLATVAGWWAPEATLGVPGAPASPPLPASARTDRPLAVLRPDWTPKGDLVAVDHRRAGPSSLIEVASRGQTWLGATWTSPVDPGRTAEASPTYWSTGAFADCAEWSFKVGRGRVTRTAVLLRGRSMALIAQQDDGLGPTGEIRLSLPDGIEATPDAETRALVLSAGRGKTSARLVPLGLPALPYPTDRGSMTVEGREVVLRQSGEGRRRWLPLLLCWGKAPTAWRVLTVAGQSRACRPEEAFAARVAWGRADEGLVVYRSLGPAALRNFLGHQTPARFLVGGFNASGDVRPYLKALA